MRIILDGDGAFPELEELHTKGQLKTGHIEAMALLENGTVGGRPAVALKVIVNGEPVLVQITMRNFQMAAAGFMARCGDLTGDCMFAADGNAAVFTWED